MASKKKGPKKVYLVEDNHNAPGRILAVFEDEDDALLFALALPQPVSVGQRTLFYGQPPRCGYNA